MVSVCRNIAKESMIPRDCHPCIPKPSVMGRIYLQMRIRNNKAIFSAPQFSSACTWNYSQMIGKGWLFPCDVTTELCRPVCFPGRRKRPQERSHMPHGPRDPWRRRQDSKENFWVPAQSTGHSGPSGKWSTCLPPRFPSMCFYLTVCPSKIPCYPLVPKPSPSRDSSLFPPDPTWTPRRWPPGLACSRELF